MPAPSSNLFLHVGKTLKDEYGRQIGTIASFSVTPNGRVDAVFVQQSNGEFLRYSSEHFKVSGEDIMLQPPIKLRVKALCDEIPLIWRKDQALTELVDKKKIPSEMYNDLHKNFEGALNQLRTDAKSTLDGIDKKIGKCNLQIRELNSALINLEIEREIGRIDENAYQAALAIIQEGLKRTNTEKSDLESLRSQLSNLLLDDIQSPTQPSAKKDAHEKTAPDTTESSPLPEPPVVVRVKNPAKATS